MKKSPRIESDRHRRKTSSATRAGGFTFVEVVVALVILSTAAGGLFAGTYLAWRQLERARDSIRTSTTILDLEYRFRTLVSGVTFAFWELSPVPETGESGFRLEYGGGEPRRIAMRLADGAIEIEADGATARFDLDATRLEATTFHGARGEATGIEITIALPSGSRERIVTIREAYGAARR